MPHSRLAHKTDLMTNSSVRNQNIDSEFRKIINLSAKPSINIIVSQNEKEKTDGPLIPSSKPKTFEGEKKKREKEKIY